MKTMIVMEHLMFCEKNYDIINEVNKICETTLEDVSLSVLNVSNKVISTNCAVFNISEVSSFSNGLLLATTIKDAEEILSTVNNSIKALYLWDIDWMFSRLFYEDIHKVLNNKDLHIFVRSDSHLDIVRNVCQKKIEIIENFELEKIWNSLENIKT